MKIGYQQIIVWQQRKRICVEETIVTDADQLARAADVETTSAGIAHEQYHAGRRFVVWIVWVSLVEVTTGTNNDKFAACFRCACYDRRG